MTKDRIVRQYRISELVPYINWLYFYHAWGLSGKPRCDKEKMKQEALDMLASWEDRFHSHAIFQLFDANSDGDDILFLEQQLRFPLAHGEKDQIGVFCSTVDGGIMDAYRHDDYLNMMAQTLSDRLAEATAEKLHEEVRKTYWGYAPDEHLTIEQQLREEYQGIRPAIGYPSLPDTSANFLIDQLLDMKQVGIRLTESGMMTPHASVSGLMFAHPMARYFELGKIGDDQLRDYARRRGVPAELMKRFLQSSLLK